MSLSELTIGAISKSKISEAILNNKRPNFKKLIYIEKYDKNS